MQLTAEPRWKPPSFFDILCASVYSFISCSPLVLQAWNREAPACQRINYVLLSWQGWHEYFSNYPQNWSQKTKAIEETTTHRGHIWRWENNSFLYFGVGKRETHTDQTNFNWSQFRPVSGSSTLLAWRRLCSYSSGQQCWPPHQIHHEIKWKVHSFETASSVISLLFGLCEQEINFLIMHPFQRRETTPGFYLWRQLGEHLVFWIQF